MLDLSLKLAAHFALLCITFLPAERLFPAHEEQKVFRPELKKDLLYFSLNPFIVAPISALLLSILGIGINASIPDTILIPLRSQPWIVQFIEIIIISELISYWIHRWSHEISWLWKFHRVHHSIEELDWLASHRQHPLEAVWLLGAANIPVIILGFNFSAFAGFILLQKLYTVFLHSNINVSFGRCHRLFASPLFHHWHHAAEAKSTFKNYATLFPFFDCLFGTFYSPENQFPKRYGLRK